MSIYQSNRMICLKMVFQSLPSDAKLQSVAIAGFFSSYKFI